MRFIAWFVAAFLAVLSPHAFAELGLDRAISEGLLSLSFDVERVTFITALGVALLSSALAGFVALRRTAAWVGGFLWFAFAYVWSFAVQVQHPGVGPDGQPQMLRQDALIGVLLALLAIGLLVTAAGATLGEAGGRLLFPPLRVLGLALLTRIRPRRPQGAVDPEARLVRSLRSLATATVLGAALLIGGSQISQFLTFGVSNQLYEPALSNSAAHGQPPSTA